MKLEDLTPIQRVKTERWIEIIRECQKSGLSNNEWCIQNGISIKSYYYYLAKIRKMAITEIPYKNNYNTPSVPSLVSPSQEIVEVRPPSSVYPSDSNCSSALTLYKGDTKIDIDANCPEWMLKEILDRYVR